MKRIYYGLAFMLSTAATAQETAPVRIGFVASLTGSVAALGQDQYDGFMLAVNLEGGKLGGVPVEVLREDDQLKPDLANQISQRLIEREDVSFITGFTGSNVMVAVADQIAASKVIMVASNAAPSILAGEKCTPYYFSTAPQVDTKAEVVGQFATDQGYQTAVLLAPNFQAGKDGMNGFKRFFTGEILEEIYTPLDQLDFSVELAQVAAAQPDVIYAFYPGSLGVNFVRQYRQAGLAGQMPLLSTALVDGVQLPALQQAALGIKTGSFWGPDMDNDENRHFVAEFEKAYGRVPSEYAAQSYDAARLIGGGLAATGGDTEDKAALIAAMADVPFASVRGGFAFNVNHFPINDMHMYDVTAAENGVQLQRIATPLEMAADAYSGDCKMPAP